MHNSLETVDLEQDSQRGFMTGRAPVFRFGLAIFVSAFLLFQVQPLLGSYILPWFGGTSGVWTTCLMFFQILLVAGYAYAHLLSRLPLRRQAQVHLMVLLASLVFLPITPSETWRTVGSRLPVLRILAILGTSVGLPYLLLATTGPLLQSWFSRQSRGASPYRLFALSNAASLLGLITYPFVVQPWLRLEPQTVFWSGGYAVFVAAVGWCAIRLWRAAPALGEGGAPETEAAEGDVPVKGQRTMWLLLPLVASALLLGITNELSLRVATVPFLWIIPMVLYLLSFIICFDHPRWYSRKVFGILLGASILAGAVPVWAVLDIPALVYILIGSITLFTSCMICHGELVRIKPHPRRLTGFYLTVSLGGAAGGLFVAVAAPVVFPDIWEVPLGILATLFLLLASIYRDPGSTFRGGRRPRAWGWMAAGLGLAGPLLMTFPIMGLYRQNLQVRTFYGVLKVFEADRGTPDARRHLTNGRIVHGTQFLDGERRTWLTSYYGPGSGVDIAIERGPRRREDRPLRAGIIGLGAGTLAGLSRPGDVFRFYEIDPMVEKLAREKFTFLSDARGKVEVVIGDGRIALEREAREEAEPLDVLVVDAFTGGSVPVHLLTRECTELYFRRLVPDGILAVHVSNHFLDLSRVVLADARAVGMKAVHVRQDGDEGLGTGQSFWVLVGRADVIDSLGIDQNRLPWDGVEPVLWTDHYSSLIRILR